MKFFVIIFTTIFLFIGCQTTSLKNETVVDEQSDDYSAPIENKTEISSIRKIDFQNFTFSWTKKFGYGEKTFNLKSGKANLSDERKLSLESITYVDVAGEYDEQALVNVKIDDGNATYQMLYVYAVENNKPKLLESFEFGENNTSFGTAFVAHGELIIETYKQQSSDAECCPSVIEISYYKWQKDKFILQNEPQKVPNGYVERVKKGRGK
ncbi:MAG TPA: hypothetical protein VNI84_10260 [Pyrinomonadaceae bacterium]|nr:hypothetical protein [Pyrinomonadaceae bacterium]